LSQIHAELEAERAAFPDRLPVYIAGINAVGQASGFAFVIPSMSRPWLQDATTVDAYGCWGVGTLRPARPGIVYRDVVVLDARNRARAVYNLSEHDLGVPANYATLKDILRTAATP